MVGILLPCRKVPLLPPALAREEVDFLVLIPVIACLVATELRALLFVESVTEGYFCHRFSQIFEGAYSRVAEEVFCLCPLPHSSSGLVVGQG